MIHVNASKLKGKSGVLRLFDVEGRVVVERKVDVIAGCEDILQLKLL
jgi:hypothetical protein